MQQFIFQSGDPKRLDHFLAGQDGMKSRSVVQRYIKNGAVKINGETIQKSGQVLENGDIVSLDTPDSSALATSIEPVDLHFEILHEDDATIVINKPRNISVHPAPTMRRDEPTILHGAAYAFKERELPFSPSATLVHRLDKETTGCLLLAKNPEAHMLLQKQFESRTVKKRYLALVYGVPSHPSAVIDAPIGRHLIERTKMSAVQMSRSREAKTTYETYASAEGASLLICDIHTGRTHQIRVHLETIGHPVLGDPTYGTSRSMERSRKLKINFLGLHAWKLEFISPDSKKQIAVEALLPGDFSSVLDSLNISL